VSELEKILHVDTWSKLHPATRLVVKILQHIRSKIDDMTEVHASLYEDEIVVTTYKSEIRIRRNIIEFKRRTVNDIIVQRAKIELSKELIDAIKKQILAILEHDAEPDYSFVVETFEKHFKQDC
jgi:CBS domain containing-hemolysin-like protein